MKEEQINRRNYSEEEIIKGCIEGKRIFQKLLYQKFASRMYSICLSYTGEKQMAQDILQEGFIKVFLNIKKFEKLGPIEAWIRTIMVNTSIDYFRKRSKLQKLIVHDPIHEEEDISAEVFQKFNAEDILDKIANLPEGARVIFNLFALEGYSHKEIAEKLNISVGTSKSQLSRAKSMLKSWLVHHY